MGWANANHIWPSLIRILTPLVNREMGSEIDEELSQPNENNATEFFENSVKLEK